jgi:regulator of nucleoside diphosphate kinase
MITTQDMHRLRTWVAYRPERSRHDAYSLAALAQKLGRARVVGSNGVEPDIVTMHSRVRLRDPRSRDELICTLVFPEDHRWEHRRLSVLAPKGCAILGARAGDIVRFDVPGGSRRMTIDEVLYQPEAAGDFHL